MLRVGLIGHGYWGPHLARNFPARAQLARICDSDPCRAAQAGHVYSARIDTAPEELIEDPSIDAIAIATSAASHFSLAMAALRAGKHVWIEKPMTCSSSAARTLIEEARRRNRVLMVDHTFVYSAPVRKIHELISTGQLGSLCYYDAVRANLGRFQEDADVLWDLAILDFLLTEEPTVMAMSGVGHLGPRSEVAYLSIKYPSGFHVHLQVSWPAPVNGKIAVEHFIQCVETGEQPLTGGGSGWRVIRLLERASEVAR